MKCVFALIGGPSGGEVAEGRIELPIRFMDILETVESGFVAYCCKVVAFVRDLWQMCICVASVGISV